MRNIGTQKKILIFNFGLGNIGSLVNALKFLETKVIVIENYKELELKANYDGVILPGVGSFDDGMKSLRDRDLDKALFEVSDTNIKILGICLGMQMLLNTSEESQNGSKGLGLFQGEVKKLSKLDAPVPHIGWTKTKSIEMIEKNTEFDINYLNGDFYYVHSFFADITNSNEVIGNFNHGSTSRTSAILKNNIMGVQFHPEKSQQSGLKLLKNYFDL